MSQPSTDRARRFHVVRDVDPSGVSGTGVVLDGVLWPDGTVSTHWRGDDWSNVFWPNLETAEAKHCYGGHSRIVWLDPAPVQARAGDPRRDVTGMSPADQHAVALQVLDDRTGLPGAGGWQGGRDLEGLTGRRQILERHAPHTAETVSYHWCKACRPAGRDPWPCANYVDAAAGLVTGLQVTS